MTRERRYDRGLPAVALLTTITLLAGGPWILPPTDAVADTSPLVRPAFSADALRQVTLSPEAGSGAWEFVWVPYLFAPDFDGTLAVGETEEQVALGSDVLLDKTEVGLFMHFEARNRDRGLGALFGIQYTELHDTEQVSPDTAVDFRFDQFVWELLGSYRAAATQTDVIDILGGIRYTGLGSTLDVSGPMASSSKRDESWVDPVIGARYLRAPTPNLLWLARADVGGFGAGSNVTFNLQGGIGALIGFGVFVIEYKYFKADYENGSGADRFKWDVTQKGLLVGVGLSF